MNQDFLNWQEAIHMLHWVCTGKGRGWWRLVDLACPDKNIVRRALLTVFRGWDGHSSTPVRPPWQWLALFFSFPGPLCRWPARWRCQRKSGCSLRHNRSLASAHVGPLLFPIKSILGNICMAVLCPSTMAWIIKDGLASSSVRPWMSLWCWWRKSAVSFELLASTPPTFDLS